MSDTVSISGLDKAEVLCALYNRARPQGMGFLHYSASPLPIDEARNLLNQRMYFDYLNGRVMKVSLEEDEFDPRLFDRDNGRGSAAEAIMELRNTGSTNPISTQIAHREQTVDAALLAQDAMSVPSSSLIAPDGVAVFHLGLADVEEILGPAIDGILGDANESD